MPPVEKVTVSLPAELLARVEERRKAEGRTRSETITDLLWRGWQVIEREAMEEEYRRAYALHPETDEERAWADWAADALFANSEWIDESDPDSTRLPPQGRAAG